MTIFSAHVSTGFTVDNETTVPASARIFTKFFFTFVLGLITKRGPNGNTEPVFFFLSSEMAGHVYNCVKPFEQMTGFKNVAKDESEL